MRVLLLGKGGVGKTTLSILLARALVRRGFRALILDVDVCSRGISRMLGVSEPAWLVEVLEEASGLGGAPHGRSVSLVPIGSCIASDGQGVLLAQAGKLMAGGEGCSCRIHLAALSFLEGLRDPRLAVLVDTGSSAEFLSRGVDGRLFDVALFVADYAYDNLEYAVRLERMCSELGFPNYIVVFNKYLPSCVELIERFRRVGFTIGGVVRFDPLIHLSWLQGGPLRASIALSDCLKLLEGLMMGGEGSDGVGEAPGG